MPENAGLARNRCHSLLQVLLLSLLPSFARAFTGRIPAGLFPEGGCSGRARVREAAVREPWHHRRWRTPLPGGTVPLQKPDCAVHAASSSAGNSDQHHRLWNAPNVLTVIRLIAIPVLFGAFYWKTAWSHAVCSSLFVFASVTDFLDGYLARRMGITSALGAFLDPVADKLMVATALVLLTERLASPWMTVPTAVIICREIGVSALREWMASVGQRDTVAVGWWGKVKTATQMASLSLLLLLAPHPSVTQLPVISGRSEACQASLALLVVSAVFTVTSAAGYVKAAWPALVQGSRGEKEGVEVSP